MKPTELPPTEGENPLDLLSPDISNLLDDSTEGTIDDYDELVAHFNESIDKRGKNRLSQLVNQGHDVYLLTAMVPSGAMVGIQVFMLLERISDNGEVISTLPDGESISNGKFDDGLILLLAHKDSSMFETVFREVFNISPNFMEVPGDLLGLSKEVTSEVNHSENEKVDMLIQQVEDLMLNENSITLNSGDIMDGSKQIDEIKVKVDDMNKLFQLVEELVLIRNQFIRLNETKDFSSVKDLNTTLDRTANDLYLAVLQLRMVSVGQIFNHLKQFVSDLSAENGKFIDFIIKGEDVSVDRKILEELVEPMKGLIHNAVVHGIEKPEDRVNNGKHRVGTIILNAQNEDESIRITIEDDGKGISAEEIKETALSLGLTSDKIIEGLIENEIGDLLTLPGFSTTDEEIQDNEMGLNAVKQRIESNSGAFEVDLNIETGFISTIVLPTNVAIKRVLLFGVENEVFAMPASNVQTIMNLNDVNTETKFDEVPLIKYMDNVIPVYNLAEKMNLASDKNEQFGIVIEKRHRMCCIQVANVIGFEEVVVKSAEENLLNLPWISGLTVLSDGRATPILDLWSLVQS